MLSLFLLLSLWATSVAIGLGATSLLLPRRAQRDRLLLAPVFGVGLVSLLSGAASYSGLSMRAAVPIVAVPLALLAAVGIARWRARGIRDDYQAAAWTHGVGFAAAMSILTGVLVLGVWDPYSDAFTYVAIADHLQAHGYFDPVDPGAYQPLLTQMATYQHLGFRMGTNFLLAYVTAAFRMPYAFDLYMPVLALGVWIAVPGFWLVCRRVLMLSRRHSGLAALLYGLHVGVPISNALWGFLPQAFGMALMFPVILLHVRATSRRQRGRALASAGLLWGVLLLTYPEMLPFVIAGVGACFAGRLLVGRLSWPDAIVAGGVPLVLGAVVAPIAAASFVELLRIQAGVVVGQDSRLTLFDYLSVLAGFRTPTLPLTQLAEFRSGVLRLGVVAAALTMVLGAVRLPSRARLMTACLAAPFAIGLAWFGAFGTNPWHPGEYGQPWSTLKVVTYACFFATVVWASGLTVLWSQRVLGRVVALAQLALFLVFFPVGSYAVAAQGAVAIRRFTGVQDAIAEYKRLPALLADLPPETPVNLVIPPEAQKHRQFVAYFLRRPVIGTWADDPYIVSRMAPAHRAPGIDARYPALVYAPGDPAVRVANLVYRKDAAIAHGEFGAGWYPVEQDGLASWRWLEEAGHIEVIVPRAGTLSLRAELAVVGAASRRVSIDVAGQPGQRVVLDVPQQWFTPMAAVNLRLPAGRYAVTVRADGEAAPMGPADPRIVRIGLRNLAWSLLPD